MNQSRLVSLLLSLCLHAAIFGAALFWPASPRRMVNLNATIIELGQYTIGAPAARRAQSPQPQPALPKPPAQTMPQAKPPEAPQPAPQQQTAANRQAPDPPKPPDATPISPATRPTPLPPVNATQAVKPQASAPKPQANATKPAPLPKDVLGRALKDLGAATAGAGATRRPNPNSVAEALGALSSGDADAGSASGGEGGDGVGIVGTYQQSLVSRIQPHWEYGGRADRKNPVAYARVKIAADGAILGATIETSSGDAAFDGSIIKAIHDTERVEAPPRADLREVVIGFAYESLAGGR